MAATTTPTGNVAPTKFDAAYWQDRWTRDDVPWKNREREVMPFQKNAEGILNALFMMADGDKPDIGTAFKGCRVFVPLCGDTPALRFWHDLGCDVVGVDIAEVSLRRAIDEHFSAIATTLTEDPFVAYGDVERTKETATLKKLQVTAEDKRTVTLYAGDAFALCEDPSFAPFDIVYDRASLIAIEPTLRKRYVDACVKKMSDPRGESVSRNSIFTGGPSEGVRKRSAVVMSVIERPEAKRDAGPPFHVGEEEVFSTFASVSEAGMARFVVPMWDEREQADKAPFVDAVYAIVANRV